MFTGIVESTGKIISLKKTKSNLSIEIECSFADELKKGQSVAHNGVCLTVESIKEQRTRDRGRYRVTAVKETLSKTNLGKLKVGNKINLERSLKVGDRLDGHFVQGHVDSTAQVKSIKKEKGSWMFKFQISPHKVTEFPQNDGVRNFVRTVFSERVLADHRTNFKFQISNLIIEKGSVCINGVSLTIVDVKKNIFSVAIIPHTFKHTNFSSLKKNDTINIEFDILGKHIQKIISARSH